MRVYFLIVGVLCAWMLVSTEAHACSCVPPDKARSYDGSDHVVHARIQGTFLSSATTRYYVARLVEDDFKGCLNTGRYVLIETPASSAACGVTLQTGQEYLLHGANAGTLLGIPRLRVILCDANAVWSELNAEHLAFLNSRYVCCGGECGCTDGSQPVNCLVDPCQVSSCDVDGAVCEANYCGGCNAEWHDPSGALVCEAPSTCDYDAPERQYVSRSPDECARIDFLCTEGSPFFDACGCGCTVPLSQAACNVGGCSGQLCVEPGD